MARDHFHGNRPSVVDSQERLFGNYMSHRLFQFDILNVATVEYVAWQYIHVAVHQDICIFRVKYKYTVCVIQSSGTNQRRGHLSITMYMQVVYTGAIQ
jgi:hypothetical protein